MNDRVATAAARYRVVRLTDATRITLVVALGALVVMASLPFWGSSGTMKLLVEFLTLMAMAQMWNLLAGYAGLVSIGQQAFVGIGAYGLYVGLDIADVGIAPTLVGVAVGSVLLALLTSLFAFRLRGGYFAVGTWVIAEVIRLLVANTKALGAGSGVSVRGLSDLTPGDRLALTYWLAVAVGFGSIALVVLIMRSRLGLALGAIRGSEVGAASLGVDITRTKRIVYVIASAATAVAGAVAYLQLLRIQPNAAFGIDWTAQMIFIVLIGGLGRIEGPIIGAIIFFVLQETLADYGSAYLVLLGVVAIAVVLFAPRGIWGVIEGLRPVALFGISRRLIPVDAGTGAEVDGPGGVSRPPEGT